MTDPNPTKGDYVQAAASILAGLMVVESNANSTDRRNTIVGIYDDKFIKRSLDLLVRIEQEVDERMEEGEL